MVVQIDSREKAKAITRILAYFGDNQIKYFSSKLFVGDYMNMDNPRLVIDRKQNLLEITSNVCQDHARFKREILRANECGIHITFLIEHGYGINSLDDVKAWQNPRLKDSPLAMSGERLWRVLDTMQRTYDIDFQFCDKKQTGEYIVRILNGESVS